MTLVLGEPKLKGNSDVIESKELSGGTAIIPGLPIKIHTDGKYKALTAGDVPVAISGKTTYSTMEGVHSGMEVAVQIADSESPAIGGQVYIIDATGALSSVSTSATAVNATFASLKDTSAIDPNTGIALATSGKNAVLINFVGGL